MDDFVKYFRIRMMGPRTFHIVRVGTPYYKPVSPEFSTSSEAYTWIVQHWQSIIFEEIVLDGPQQYST